jgi:hypothetical protein
MQPANFTSPPDMPALRTIGGGSLSPGGRLWLWIVSSAGYYRWIAEVR